MRLFVVIVIISGSGVCANVDDRNNTQELYKLDGESEKTIEVLVEKDVLVPDTIMTQNPIIATSANVVNIKMQLGNSHARHVLLENMLTNTVKKTYVLNARIMMVPAIRKAKCPCVIQMTAHH